MCQKIKKISKNSKKKSKNIYFQFLGNNFNNDEFYYDETCKP